MLTEMITISMILIMVDYVNDKMSNEARDDKMSDGDNTENDNEDFW